MSLENPLRSHVEALYIVVETNIQNAVNPLPLKPKRKQKKKASIGDWEKTVPLKCKKPLTLRDAYMCVFLD